MEGTNAQEILTLGSFMSRPKDKNLPEASQEHLLGTLFHHFLQKARGYVDGFTWLMKETTNKKYSYANG
jgi:hypothetical protein